MTKKNLLLILPLGAALTVGCRPTTPDPAPSDLAYFPLQTGDYWVYQVAQETYTPATPPVRATFQLQQRVSGSSVRNGREVFAVEEAVRPNAQAGWQVTALRTVYATPAEVVDGGNAPVVLMAFPVAEGQAWNANRYNSERPAEWRYADVGRAFAVGSRRYEATATVVGAADSSLVSLAKNRRVYAPGVGLIFREEASLAYCQSSPACIGTGRVEAGRTLRWELVETNRQP